jgi:hypothetical protein
MLVEIDRTNEMEAASLLAEGFPGVSVAVWRNRIERLRTHADNAEAGIATGYVLVTEGVMSGIVLTPASRRPGADGGWETVLNLSSWYVRPAQRWRAALMLRRVMRQPVSMITELTPSATLEAMMPALGLHPINAGESFIFLPSVAGTRFSGARVEEHGRVRARVEPWLAALIVRHEQVGCLAAALDTPEGIVTLLFKRRMRKGLPTLQLVYCDRHCALIRNMDSVARFLIARGHMILVLDIARDEHVARRTPGVQRPRHGRKYASKPPAPNIIDHAGSELALFEF